MVIKREMLRFEGEDYEGAFCACHDTRDMVNWRWAQRTSEGALVAPRREQGRSVETETMFDHCFQGEG